MREVPHDTVVEELTNRGYNLEWVSEFEKEQVESAGEYLSDDVSRSGALDWFEVEGQYTDGLFEDPRTELDFTLFFTGEASSLMVGRMMYYMTSAFGLDYTYENLVDDIESLAGTDYYSAPFDREAALSEKP